MKHTNQPENRNWLLKPSDLILLLSLSLLVIPLNAQEDEEDNEDDVYEISPFVVQDEGDTGYIATSTLAGTRLRSSLQDIGASVQVITTEFLDDIGATESNDLLLFTTSTETTGLGGNFSGGNALVNNRVQVGGVLANPQGTNRVRGLGAPDNTRDFFLTNIPFDSYNTGRIEINRGANAILFGLGSPSGVLNAALNRAVFDEINTVELRLQDGGKDLSTRATLDWNRVLIEDKLAIRVNVLQADRNYSQRPTFQDQERYYVTATWTPLENTALRVSYENGHMRANSPDPIGPLQAIDEYIREIGRYHAALAADGDYPDTNLPLTYDPWRFSMRFPGYRRVDQQVDGYDNPFSNQGFGQHLGMVWSGNTAEPDYGFSAVIPNAPQYRVDLDPTMDGFQHKVFYDAARPYPATNARNPVGGRNFWRVDNAGLNNNRPENDFTGVYEGFTDLDVFDFSKYLIAGTAPFQDRDFNALNVTLEQTFLDNKLGFELAFTEQEFERQVFHGFPGPANGIYIDINETLPIGSFDYTNDPAQPLEPQPNPNFGRPFIFGNANENRLSNSRESIRFTGFGELDSKWFFGEESLLAYILGRHVFTALVARQENDNQTLNFSQRVVGPEEYNLNSWPGNNPAQRQWRYLTYLGPAVDLVSNPAGITRDMFEINPVDRQQIMNPGGKVTTTWYEVDRQELVTVDLERELTVINGESNNTVNDSLAFITQSFLLDENLVTTLGWRKDEVEEVLRNTPIIVGTPSADAQADSLGIVNNNYRGAGTVARNAEGEYLFENPELTFVEDDIFSWGAVLKLPNDWNPFPWMNHASIFYNTSENFQPAPGRKDHLGRTLPSPTGTTKDYGFNFTFLDEKINLRVNRFEAAINNASNTSVNAAYNQAGTGSMYGFMNNFLGNLATADFDEIEEDPDSPFFGEKVRIPFDEALALFNEFTQFLGASINRETNTLTLDQSNPRHRLWIENNWRLTFNEGLGVTDGLDQTAEGQTDILDQVAEGYEVELVANPFRGMRVLVNFAQTESANSNIAPNMRNWIEEEFGPVFAGTPDNPSKFGRLIRGNPANRPELFPNANTNTSFWVDNVLRNWEVIKAQEGTFSPELRKYRLNVVVNYDFQEGFLRGFGVGFSTRYQSRVAIGFPIELDEEGIPKPDITNPFYGPSEIDWGFRLAYRTRIFDDKVNWRLQLNLSNIFSDKRDLIPVRVTDNGRLAQVRTAPPKGFILSSRFDW